MSEQIKFIRTPIPMLQIITGGGIRFSTMIELWGSTKAGKSTTCYQSAGYFLEDFGDKALLKVLDSESSFDEIRMKFVFGLDNRNDSRIEIKPAFFVEDGMKKIIDWVSELPDDKYMMIIWDTISTSPTKSSYNATREAKTSDDMTMWSGGQGDRPRVIKHYSRDIMSSIYNKNVSVWFPNQVFSSMNSYGASEVSGEGSAFHHNLHYSLHFKRKEAVFEKGEENISNHTISNVSLTKSKFSPEFKETPIFINNKLGGIIDERMSFFLHAKNQERIQNAGGYFYYKLIPDEKKKQLVPDPNAKGMRWKDLVSSDEAYNFLVKQMILDMRRQFPVVDKLYQVQGHPSLSSYEDYTNTDVTELDDIQKTKSSFYLESFLNTNKKSPESSSIPKKTEHIEKIDIVDKPNTKKVVLK